MYGILGGVKMIFRLRVPGDSTHPIHYYTIHQPAYNTYTYTRPASERTSLQDHQFSLDRRVKYQRDRAWRLLGTPYLLS